MQSKMNVQEMPPKWPADGLESVPNCPICGAANRKLLHEGLTDQIFFCAPGEWSMYCCGLCGSAYLDPRPTPNSIGLAYQRYFTHDETSSYESLSFIGKLRRKFANGYRNYRYGTQDYPASIFGIVVATFMPNGRKIIEADMRHLPTGTGKGKLLDLGCGNGKFLLRARNAGWDVVGVDFDPKAVEAACKQGIDVRRGGVETLDPSVEQFDVITLAHVIEHVHHPVDTLQACYRLLKPGGYLWIDTPNITSEGHRLFGANWRGLEPPRHLVLFSLESMLTALSTAGFSEVKVQPYRPLCDGIFHASKAIEEGVEPYLWQRRNDLSRIVTKAERLASCDPGCREFITVKAWKK